MRKIRRYYYTVILQKQGGLGALDHRWRHSPGLGVFMVSEGQDHAHRGDDDPDHTGHADHDCDHGLEGNEATRGTHRVPEYQRHTDEHERLRPLGDLVNLAKIQQHSRPSSQKCI